MKRILFILAISLCCAGVARAQYWGNGMRQVYSINYQTSVPIGGSRDFIPNMSWEGININWAYFVTDNITVGLDLSYNNYSHKVGQKVYRPDENTAINAAQYRYTQVFPIKVQAKYFMAPFGPGLQAYTGLGIGALSAGEHIIIQDIDVWDNNCGFLLSPEIGLLIPFGADNYWGANITAGYNWSTNKADIGGIRFDNRQSFYMNIGLYMALF